MNKKRIKQGSALSMYGGMPGSRDHNADGGGLAEDSLVLPDLIRSGNCRLPTAVLQHSLWLLPCSQVVCRVKSATPQASH